MLPVAPEAPANSWDGDQGAYWATHARRFNEGVAAYRDPFFAAAAVDVSSKVLDIGCGSGQTTRDAARCATAGSALGVDLSSRMIELARPQLWPLAVTNLRRRRAPLP